MKFEKLTTTVENLKKEGWTDEDVYETLQNKHFKEMIEAKSAEKFLKNYKKQLNNLNFLELCGVESIK